MAGFLSLAVGVLAAQAAVHKLNDYAYDVVAEAETAERESPLTFRLVGSALRISIALV